MTSKTTRSKAFPAELRERAVRLVREQEAEHATRAAAIRSVAVWWRGTSAVDMPLRLDDADAAPTCPPRPQPQAA